MKCLFVFDAADDPAIRIVDELRATVPTRIVIAGPATDSGQKVHNLRVAVNEIDPQSEVLVFVDTDARPAKDWLRKLVAPLADETIGASTGYRWFIPERGGIASRLRSVWNASVASALGSDTAKKLLLGRINCNPSGDFYEAQRERALARHRLRRLHDHARSQRSKTPDPLHAQLSRRFRSATATFASCSNSPPARSRSRASTLPTSGFHYCSAPLSSPSPSSAALSC